MYQQCLKLIYLFILWYLGLKIGKSTEGNVNKALVAPFTPGCKKSYDLEALN